MKKFLLGAMMAVTTLFMASCSTSGGSSNYKQGGEKPKIDAEAGTVNGKAYDNKEDFCWECNVTEKVAGLSATSTTYAWGTEFEAVATMEMTMWSIAQGGVGSATYSLSKTNIKNAEDCFSKNSGDRE